MSDQGKKYYVVREDILPDSIMKSIQAVEMLSRGDALNVNEVVGKLGIARSTFYKYKDKVFPFISQEKSNILTVSMKLEHIAGVLSGVLNYLAYINVNILTINQNLPLHGAAYVTLTLSVQEMSISIEDLVIKLKELKGVTVVEIIGKS